MSSLSSLPICAAFMSKSSGKYLRYKVDDGAGASSRQLLELSGDDAVNPYTRFYIEPSNKYDGFVHVRCCYNNKYWVAEQRPNGDEWWIAGGADEAEEDLSLQSCTLFQLKPAGEDTNTIRLMHARLGKYAGIVSDSSADRANGNFQAFLRVSGKKQSAELHLTLVKLPQWVLPKHVCFIGSNGGYLRAQLVGAVNRLLFTANDMEDPAARHTTVTNSDGTATRIKSQGLGGLFWRRRAPIPGDNWHWVLADSSDDDDDDNNNNDRNTLFQPFLLDSVHEGEIRVALLSLGNNLFCKRFTTSILHGFAAMDPDTTEAEPQLRMQEPVVSRAISVVQFSLAQARLYDEEVLTLGTASATNNTSSPAMAKLTFEITLTEKHRWSSSVTLRSPVVNTTISSQLPSRVDEDHNWGIVAGLNSFNGMYSWGATNVRTSRETVVQFVALPPMTKVTATCRAKTSSYDVPFSYRQADTLIGGEELSLEFEDGIFSGQNFHSLVYNYETENITI